MNRKHNPIVSLAAMVLLATILVLTCSACNKEAEASPRFIIEQVPNNGAVHQHTVIITDTETGVQYLYYKSYNSGGLTVLQPGEG